MPRQYWNVLSAEGMWEVRKQGESAGTRYRTQEEAIEAARFAAASHHAGTRHPSGIRIQDREGRWRDERSYGDDPMPPRG